MTRVSEIVKYHFVKPHFRTVRVAARHTYPAATGAPQIFHTDIWTNRLHVSRISGLFLIFILPKSFLDELSSHIISV
jgi:hypothetical protein